MKTTLNINDSLLAEAKAFASQQQTSLTRLIEEGLRLRLRAQKTHSQKTQQQIHVYKGRGGLAAGLNPLRNKAMWDATE